MNWLHPKIVQICKQQKTQKAMAILKEFNPIEITLNDKHNKGIKNEVRFYYKDKLVRFWPYSGIFEGEGLRSGRGINQLLMQVKV